MESFSRQGRESEQYLPTIKTNRRGFSKICFVFLLIFSILRYKLGLKKWKIRKKCFRTGRSGLDKD